MSEHINELYDKNGNLIGALLTAEAWNHVKKDVMSSLGVKEKQPVPAEKPEPTKDWITLTEYWDYPYPVDYDVKCEHCGNETPDWRNDEPRRFWLSSANLAGLVAFRCMNCQSKVVKKHFKDEIITECTPFQADKQLNKEGRY